MYNSLLFKISLCGIGAFYPEMSLSFRKVTEYYYT